MENILVWSDNVCAGICNRKNITFKKIKNKKRNHAKKIL